MRKFALSIIFITVITAALAWNTYAKEEAVSGKTSKAGSRISRILIDRVAPPLIKGMARIYVYTADIDKAKLINIDKILRMDEAKYKKRLAKVCSDLKEAGLQERLGIHKDMEKEEAVKLVDSFTKEDILKLINSVPNESISKILRMHLEKHPDKSPKDKKRLTEQLVLLKNKISNKLYSRQK